METRMQYDVQDKQLRFHVRQRVATTHEMELKATGLLDPSTGTATYRAALKKYATSGTLLKDVGSTPLRIGGGLALVPKSWGPTVRTVSSSSAPAMPPARPVLTASVAKKVALFEGPNTILTLRAAADFDPATRAVVSRTGVAKVSYKVRGFTRRQDLKLSAGLTVDWPAGKRDPKAAPFLQVRENNWSATLRNGRAVLTYDL